MRPAVLAGIGLLLLPTAAGAERKLATSGPLTASIAGGSLCRPSVPITVRSGDAAAFTGDPRALEKLVAAIRVAAGFECQGKTAPQQLVITGKVGNAPVYQGEASAAAGWALVDATGPASPLDLGEADAGPTEPVAIEAPSITNDAPGAADENIERADASSTEQQAAPADSANGKLQVRSESPRESPTGLVHPNGPFRPWPISIIDGIATFTYDTTWRKQLPYESRLPLADLIAISIAKSSPAYLDDEANIRILQHLFNDQERKKTFDRNPLLPTIWAGKNEFAQARSKKDFEERLAPLLRDLAPAVPFSFGFVADAHIQAYDPAKARFPVGTTLSPDSSERNELFSAISTSGGYTAVPNFQWPDPSWPVPAEKAEASISVFDEYRQAKLMAVLEVHDIDHAAKRVQVRLQRLSLFTKDLEQRLYDYPVTEDAPLVTAPELPAKLVVADTAPFDAIVRCGWFAVAGGQDVAPDITGDCWNKVLARDEEFYRRPIDGLAPNDARRPFFPRAGSPAYRRDLSALDATDVDKLFRWLKLYVTSLSELWLSPRQIQRNHGAEDAFADLAAGFDDQNTSVLKLKRFAEENHLQDDQILPGPVFWGGQKQVGLAIVLPNSAELYRTVIPAATLARYRGSQLTASAKVRVGNIRFVTDDAGAPVLLVDALPLEAVVMAKGEMALRRSFADVPALSGRSFTEASPGPAAPEVRPTDLGPAEGPPAAAPAGALPLGRGLLDLLITGSVGDRLSPEAMAHLVERRWEIENTSTSGPRFFVRGKRRPTTDEAAGLATAFVAWARQQAPTLPVRVTASATKEVGAGRGAILWSDLPCFGYDLSAGTGWSFDPPSSCKRNNMEADPRCQAMAAVSAVSRFLRPLDGSCGRVDAKLPFKDPVKLVGRFPQSLPTPIVKALGGKQSLQLDVTLEIAGVDLSSERPRSTDLLPPEMVRRAGFDPDRGERAADPSEFVTLDIRLVDARYRDTAGHDVESRAADGDQILANVLRSAESLTRPDDSALPSQQPYGPDLIGIRLGMGFEEAERTIRQHMKVERVLEGIRAKEAENPGYPQPLHSGELFIAEGGTEMIAIIDEPPAVSGRVLAAWRRVSIPVGTIDPAEVLSAIGAKYGDPGSIGGLSVDVPVIWTSPDRTRCRTIYNGYGKKEPLDMAWNDDGRPIGTTPALATAKGPSIPRPLYEPLAEGSKKWADCGPIVTAELLTARNAGGQAHRLDMTLTDFGPYLSAYADNRRPPPASQRAAPPAEPYGPDMIGIKLGMGMKEAEEQIRRHMKVGRTLDAASAEPPLLPGTKVSGKLFLSEDEHELVAIIDGPASVAGTVRAAWRQVFTPTSLATVASGMTEKYGQPTFEGASDTLLYWADKGDRRCEMALTQALEYRAPLSQQWRDTDGPFAWTAPDGDQAPTSPGLLLPGIAESVNGAACGPWLTLQFSAGSGTSHLVETTLSDTAAFIQAQAVNPLPQPNAPTAAIKF